MCLASAVFPVLHNLNQFCHKDVSVSALALNQNQMAPRVVTPSSASD